MTLPCCQKSLTGQHYTAGPDSSTCYLCGATLPRVRVTVSGDSRTTQDGGSS